MASKGMLKNPIVIIALIIVLALAGGFVYKKMKGPKNIPSGLTPVPEYNTGTINAPMEGTIAVGGSSRAYTAKSGCSKCSRGM
jgi:hypothetical protein